MPLSRASFTRLGVIVVVAVIVVAGSSIGPLIQPQGVTQPTYEEYQVSNLVSDPPDSDGQLRGVAADDTGTILIDNAHFNRWEQDEIQPFISAITETGYNVKIHTAEDDLGSQLSQADAFVVIDPGVSYEEDEINRIEDFVDAGGRLALFGEPTRTAITQTGLAAQLTTLQNRLGSLSNTFGIEFGDGYLFNMANNDGNYRNVFGTPAGQNPLLSDVSRVAMYTSTAVSSAEGENLLVATDGTKNIRGGTSGSHALAVRNGNVVAIGDSTFLRGGSFTVVNNDQFLENIVTFLVNADPKRTLKNYPGTIDQSPVIRYTDADLLDAAQTVANDLRRDGRETTLSLHRQSIPQDETDILITTYANLDEHQPSGLGITVKDGRVRVPGYESNTTGVIVIRKPPDGDDVDLVIVADTPERASQAATMLVTGQFREHIVSTNTVVIRTRATDSSTGGL